MSVRELVEKAKKDEEDYLKKIKKEKDLAAKKKADKEAEKEANTLINSFERWLFNIESTEEKVAEIIHKNYQHYIDNNGREDTFKAAINRPNFKDWKKSLEEKFDIKIYIYRDHTHETRYSNSGYAVGYDSIFQGVKAEVRLK